MSHILQMRHLRRSRFGLGAVGNNDRCFLLVGDRAATKTITGLGKVRHSDPKIFEGFDHVEERFEVGGFGQITIGMQIIRPGHVFRIL